MMGWFENLVLWEPASGLRVNEVVYGTGRHSMKCKVLPGEFVTKDDFNTIHGEIEAGETLSTAHGHFEPGWRWVKDV